MTDAVEMARRDERLRCAQVADMVADAWAAMPLPFARERMRGAEAVAQKIRELEPQT